MHYQKETMQNELENAMCHTSNSQLIGLHSNTVQAKRVTVAIQLWLALPGRITGPWSPLAGSGHSGVYVWRSPLSNLKTETAVKDTLRPLAQLREQHLGINLVAKMQPAHLKDIRCWGLIGHLCITHVRRVKNKHLALILQCADVANISSHPRASPAFSSCALFGHALAAHRGSQSFCRSSALAVPSIPLVFDCLGLFWVWPSH